MVSPCVPGYTHGVSSRSTTLSTRTSVAFGVLSLGMETYCVCPAVSNALPSTHLSDLKALTHDLLYETYRTEKLSRTVHSEATDSSILPEELATQSVRLKEEQLRREEEKVGDFTASTRNLRADMCVRCSCGRSSSGCNARSTRRGRSSWRRKSRSGMPHVPQLQTSCTRLIFVAAHRNLESRLAAQGSQSEFRE